MRMPRREFERLVVEALNLIPSEFHAYLENVQIVIEDKPSNRLFDDLGIPPEESLYGLYTGTPLPERSYDAIILPDCITIYRDTLLEDFNDREQLRREVARTVIHEVAHHFGIDDDRLAQLGWE